MTFRYNVDGSTYEFHNEKTDGKNKKKRECK